MVSFQRMSTYASALILVSMTQVSSLLNKIPQCATKQWRTVTTNVGSSTTISSTTTFRRPNNNKNKRSFSHSLRNNSQIYQQKLPSITTTQLVGKDHDTSNDFNRRNMQHVLNTAEIAAYQAGEIMRATFGKISISRTKINSRDLVTESDVKCQSVIKDIIRSEFPQDGFLGEEDVSVGSLASSEALKNAMDNVLLDNKYGRESDEEKMQEKEEGGTRSEKKLLWIVDPIDGTTNFQAGLCMFCVSIGVVSLEKVPKNKGEKGDNDDDCKEYPVVVAGVIYNPILNEIVSAVRGRGCYVNGQKLEMKTDSPPTNDDERLKNALINVGFPVSSDSALNASSRAVAALATKVRGIRMIASASQVMSWVAQGKLNAYISWDLNSWDVAAGMVIVEEAGGYVSNFDGSRADISSRDLIVTCSETGAESGSQQQSDNCQMHALNREIRDVLIINDCLKY